MVQLSEYVFKKAPNWKKISLIIIENLGELKYPLPETVYSPELLK